MSQPLIGHPQQYLKDPNAPMGIVGLILAFLLPPIGLPVSIVAKRRSTADGFDNQWATYGLYIGIPMLVMWFLAPAIPVIPMSW